METEEDKKIAKILKNIKGKPQFGLGQVPQYGKSRPVNDTYTKRWNEIFGKDKEKFNKLQQEQRDLDASYQQSKLNKKERDDKEK